MGQPKSRVISASCVGMPPSGIPVAISGNPGLAASARVLRKGRADGVTDRLPMKRARPAAPFFTQSATTSGTSRLLTFGVTTPIGMILGSVAAMLNRKSLPFRASAWRARRLSTAAKSTPVFSMAAKSSGNPIGSLRMK